MYLLVVPPTPPTPPPSLACQVLSVGCPAAPTPPNPDSLAAILPYLQTEVAAPTWTGAFTKPSGMTGMGDYEHENYNYLFHPPLRTKRTIGGKKSGCGCGCGGGCAKNPSVGMGLFDSGADISGWGMPEWSIVGLASLGALSVLVQTSKGTSSLGRAIRRRRRS